MSAYLGHLYTVPGHVTCSAASGVAYSPEIFGFYFLRWSGKRPLFPKLPPGNTGELFTFVKKPSVCKPCVAFTKMP